MSGTTLTWTVTDFRNNTVTVEATDLQECLDIALDTHRSALYGNPEHWSIAASDGQRYPQQTEYDWAVNELGY